MKTISKLALIAAFATGTSGLALSAPAFAKDKKADAAPAMKLSPEVQKPGVAAQTALAAKDYAGAQTAIDQIDAAAKTDYEKYIGAALRYQLENEKLVAAQTANPNAPINETTLAGPLDALIAKKRDGGELSDDEIHDLVSGVVDGSLGDAQLGAFLMAVCCNGMSAEETAWLTVAMRDSGRVLRHDHVSQQKVDKHSTGGVGDKVSLLLAPLAALLDEADPIARTLLDRAVLYVVPHMNPDGSFRGHLRNNAMGANLNREWHAPTEARSPEVAFTLAAMDETGVDLCLDVHGDEELPYNFISGAEGTPGFSPRLAGLDARFQEALERANPDFQRVHGYPVDAPGTADMSMCTNAVGERFDCLAMTLEMPFKDNANAPDERVGWSPDRCASLGASALDAMVAVVDDLR